MAARLLLPGYGGKYTSETITGSVAGQAGADTLDVSLCSQFAVQVAAVTTPGASTFTVEHSLDGSNFAAVGSAIAIALGNIARFSLTSGPYGLIRLKVTDAAAAVQVSFNVVGFPTQREA